jgi:hypothetical protein
VEYWSDQLWSSYTGAVTKITCKNLGQYMYHLIGLFSTCPVPMQVRLTEFWCTSSPTFISQSLQNCLN